MNNTQIGNLNSYKSKYLKYNGSDNLNSYKSKYLKYKSKYMKLKNQLAGKRDSSPEDEYSTEPVFSKEELELSDMQKINLSKNNVKIENNKISFQDKSFLTVLQNKLISFQEDKIKVSINILFVDKPKSILGLINNLKIQNQELIISSNPNDQRISFTMPVNFNTGEAFVYFSIKSRQNTLKRLNIDLVDSKLEAYFQMLKEINIYKNLKKNGASEKELKQKLFEMDMTLEYYGESELFLEDSIRNFKEKCKREIQSSDFFSFLGPPKHIVNHNC